MGLTSRSAQFALAALTLALAGCSTDAAPPRTSPAPTFVPTPYPTVSLGFKVADTPAPVHQRRRHKVRPTPTPFVAPPGPYVRLSPSSGPPVGRSILIRAGNLPPSSAVQLVWSPTGRRSAVTRTAYTDRKGNMSTDFSVPGSTPGIYQVMASVDGVAWAKARYTVTSDAALHVVVSSGAGGEMVRVSGKRFVSRLHLLLIVYPMFQGGPVLVLGRTQADRHGAFTFVQGSRQLIPGQYELRAWSTDALSAQMAEAFFQVII